jgi:hypothetical protein
MFLLRTILDERCTAARLKFGFQLFSEGQEERCMLMTYWVLISSFFRFLQCILP